ncbi:hypothetical protein D3C76_974910 [compost metagenome]
MSSIHYTGSKIVGGKPMSRGDFLNYFNRDLDPEVENAAEAGYLVEYLDGGKPNHPDHKGYISWSPADVFVKNYISIGDITGLPAFIVRLKAERAENYDRLQKLTEFLYKQDLLSQPEDSLTDAQKEAIKNLPALSIEHLALQQEQQSIMQQLEVLLTKRLDLLLPEARVEHKASILFSVANGTRFDIMPRIIKALDGQIDACCYTGTIHAIPVDKIKVFSADGVELTDVKLNVDKLARGFGISGNINEELLFDVGLDVQRGITHVTSSFSENYKIEIEVQMADINRRLV